MVFGIILRRAPSASDGHPSRRWTQVVSVVFVLWLIPYLNFRFSPQEWVGEVKGLQPQLYGISISGYFLPERGFIGWLDLAALAAGAALTALLILHLRKPLVVIPLSWLGKGQLFYIAFLWAISAMNFMLVIPRFTPVRLVTEWFMALNAAASTFLLVYASTEETPHQVPISPDRPYAATIRNVALAGLLGAIIVPPIGFAVKTLCWGHKYAGPPVIDNGPLLNDPVRFGPHNTNTVR
jgi:hypothetical protein